MKIPIENVYYLLCYAWKHAQDAEETELAEESLRSVPDLLAWVLSHRVNRLIRRGLERNYSEEIVEYPGIRGRVRLADTIGSGVLVRGRTICVVDELRHDILQNQILRSTLATVLKLPKLDRRVRERARLAYTKLAGISEIPVTNGMFRLVQIHRNNRDYRFLMHVCRLIHNSLLVGESRGDVRFYDFRRDDAVMWSVFEDFVANFLDREQTEFDVRIQSTMKWHNAASAHPDNLKMLPQMKPDVVLESRARRIVLDTKYSRRPLRTNQYGQQKVAPGHLYQIAAYIDNRDLEKPDGPPHEGVLLYPVVEKPFHLRYRLNGRVVQVRTIDLSQPWSAVAEEMLSLTT